jgi:hypothetical protein
MMPISNLILIFYYDFKMVIESDLSEGVILAGLLLHILIQEATQELRWPILLKNVLLLFMQ